MPRVMAEETEVDPLSDDVEEVLTAEEENAEAARLRPVGDGQRVGDLTDGGIVGGAKLTPMQDGRKVEKGRAASRYAWTLYGARTEVPLIWNTDGTISDNGRRFLTKRHCLCCNSGGFHGVMCPNCAKNSCPRCGGGLDRKRHVYSFYARRVDVPFPTQFFGPVECFLEGCPRRSDRGFLTEEAMRFHASTRHTRQYAIYRDTQAAAKSADVDSLREQVNALTLALLRGAPVAPPQTAPAVVETAEAKRARASARGSAAAKASWARRKANAKEAKLEKRQPV